MSSLKRIKQLERAKQSARVPDSVPLDPIVFAESIGFTLDAWQHDLLQSEQDRIILNCSRQSGKSTAVAILALHHALTVRDAVVLIFSPSYRQSTELFKKILTFYHRCDRPIKASTKTTSTLQLTNGARIVSLPGQESTIRGFSAVSLLLIDEASRVDDALYFAVRPMLTVSQGRMVLLSTPHGRRGFFYDEWTEGKDWQRFEVMAADCPRIAGDFLRREREALGEYWYQQEYCCVFGENEASVFGWDDVQRAFAEDVEVWDIKVALLKEHGRDSGSAEDVELWDIE